MSSTMLGITSGITPKRGVLREHEQHAHRRRHRRVRQAGELDDVHQRAQVLALDHQLADAALARLRLDVGRHAVDQRLGAAADLHDQHDAHHRQAAAAGEQEQRAQRRARRQSKVSSKPDCVSPEPASTFTDSAPRRTSAAPAPAPGRCSSESLMPPCMHRAGSHARRQRDVDAPPERVGQLVRVDRPRWRRRCASTAAGRRGSVAPSRSGRSRAATTCRAGDRERARRGMKRRRT